jgi:hypothetical protein
MEEGLLAHTAHRALSIVSSAEILLNLALAALRAVNPH